MTAPRRLNAEQRLRHAEIIIAYRHAEAGREAAGLSQPQLTVLDTIQELTESLTVPPTQFELTTALGYASTATIAGHLLRLEALGYLRRTGEARGVVLTGKPFGAPCEHCAGSGRRP